MNELGAVNVLFVDIKLKWYSSSQLLA